MISYLKGKIISKSANSVIIVINGIGCEVSIPTRSLSILPINGEDVILHTILHVREDELKLFGFLSEFERQIFQLLLKVTGVGPKLAMQAISTLTANEILFALRQNKTEIITRIPGVGVKLAQRLVLELQTEASKLEPESTEHMMTDISTEAYQALMALGFNPDKIRTVVNEVIRQNPQYETEEVIRQALKRLTT